MLEQLLTPTFLLELMKTMPIIKWDKIDFMFSLAYFKQ